MTTSDRRRRPSRRTCSSRTYREARRGDRRRATPRRDDRRGCSSSSRRATSPPTTSRSCSTSPTSTATWTWTSRATAPRCRSSGADLSPAGRRERRGAGRAAGADPARGLPRDRRAVPADAGHLRLPGARSARSWSSWPRRRSPRCKESGEPVSLDADVAVRAQGRARRRGRRRPDLGVRGRRAAPVRGGPARRDAWTATMFHVKRPPRPSGAEGVSV